MGMLGSRQLVLETSPRLRILTLLLFYFTQGFPTGLFTIAVPAWMAARGADTIATATVVGISTLPWSLKLINGFLIDRYAYLPMGRRRSWIIGAQAFVVLAFLAGALLAPDHRDVALLAAIGFCANLGIAFQDVGIDSLAVDIMPENERSQAAGIMFGAQMLGIAAATAFGGLLLDDWGFSVCMVIAAMVPAAVMTFGIVIRERSGEKRLPWTAGVSHPHNLSLQVSAWLPLLRTSLRAITVPISLAMIMVLLTRGIPFGAHESFHPVLTTGTTGWSMEHYSRVQALATLISGLICMSVGGWFVGKIGEQRALAGLLALGAALIAIMGLRQDLWSSSTFVTAYIIAIQIVLVLVMVALVPICMQLCVPSVAATQFTIYMAFGNFGRPIGAVLAGNTAGLGNPELLYGLVAAIWLAMAALAIMLRIPQNNPAFEKAADALPQGEGLAPLRD
jgi:PAT family beta-lactamase induction signal transducer AmpG